MFIECTGVTQETRNGLSKIYLMKGALTVSQDDDTSWVSGTCAEDHSGKVTVLKFTKFGALDNMDCRLQIFETYLMKSFHF